MLIGLPSHFPAPAWKDGSRIGPCNQGSSRDRCSPEPGPDLESRAARRRISGYGHANGVPRAQGGSDRVGGGCGGPRRTSGVGPLDADVIGADSPYKFIPRQDDHITVHSAIGLDNESRVLVRGVIGVDHDVAFDRVGVVVTNGISRP